MFFLEPYYIAILKENVSDKCTRKLRIQWLEKNGKSVAVEKTYIYSYEDTIWLHNIIFEVQLMKKGRMYFILPEAEEKRILSFLSNELTNDEGNIAIVYDWFKYF